MALTGELFALATAVLWAFSATVFGTVTARINSVKANILRLVIAEIYLGLTLVFRSSAVSASAGQVTLLVISGVIGLALGDSFLFRAFQEVGARITMLLMALAPAIGAVVAVWVLEERLSPFSILGMLVTLAGIGIVVTERSAGGTARLIVSPKGILLGLLAAAGQGLGLIAAKLAFRTGPVDPMFATAVRIAGGLALLIPAAGLTGRLRGIFVSVRAQPGTAGLLALGALLGPFLGIATSLIAVAHTTVGVASTIMATVPVLMLPIAWILHRERIAWKALSGAVLAVAGVAMLFLE